MATSVGTYKYQPDRIPQIRQAGKQIVVGQESADVCIRADVHKTDRQTTPEALRKFRKSQNDMPGKKQVHPGLYNDPAYKPAEFSYGKHTFDSEHVDRVIKA